MFKLLCAQIAYQGCITFEEENEGKEEEEDPVFY